jgi:hypothetical protein
MLLFLQDIAEPMGNVQGRYLLKNDDLEFYKRDNQNIRQTQIRNFLLICDPQIPRSGISWTLNYFYLRVKGGSNIDLRPTPANKGFILSFLF